MIENYEKVVFLVDPDSAVRDSVRTLLESFGVTVHAYASGRSLLNNAHINGHDCILVENALPDMSGLDLLEHLRQKGVRAPLVLMSSANDRGFEVLATAQNIAAVMRKPLHSEDLLEMIKAL